MNRTIERERETDRGNATREAIERRGRRNEERGRERTRTRRDREEGGRER